GGKACGVDLQLLDVHTRGMLERLREELVSRGEVVRRRRERDTGLACDRPVRDRTRAFATHHGQCGFENPAALGRAAFASSRSGCGAQWAPARLSPITPAMISAMQPSRSTLTGSPKAIIPISAIAAVPIPAQMAEVGP